MEETFFLWNLKILMFVCMPQYLHLVHSCIFLHIGFIAICSHRWSFLHVSSSWITKKVQFFFSRHIMTGLLSFLATASSSIVFYYKCCFTPRNRVTNVNLNSCCLNCCPNQHVLSYGVLVFQHKFDADMKPFWSLMAGVDYLSVAAFDDLLPSHYVFLEGRVRISCLIIQTLVVECT